MALPAVLLKAKGAIKKGATAYKAGKQAKNLTDGEEATSSLFNKAKLPIAIGGFFFAVAAFFLIIIVAIPFMFANEAFGSGSDQNEGTGGPILLIAGHSYAPYCEQVTNECREEDINSSPSGYFEPTETRELVKLVKTELENLNVRVDIANQLMAPNDSRMNTSFYVEKVLNTSTFQSINWSKYKYVLEIHFNAGSGNDRGPLLVKKSSDYSTNADAGIIEAVTKNLGTKQLNDSIQGINSINYFMERNIPITYLETEFYDNKSAMDKYTEKKGQIAKDIAQAIRNTYGKASGGGDYLQWAIDIANDDSHGYSQANRYGNPDYDCSSLVWYSLVDGAGFDPNQLGGAAFSIPFMPSILKNAGFTEYPYKGEADLQPGDILLRTNHTEIYAGNSQTVGAHSAENGGKFGEGGDQTGREIDIRANTGNWSTYYRLES